MMKLVTKTGTILHVDQPIWLPHPLILQLLDTKLVPSDYEPVTRPPIFLMLGCLGSSENLGQCFHFLEQEFGLPDIEGDFHLSRNVSLGDNNYVSMHWTLGRMLTHSQRFLADTISSKSGDLIKNRQRAIDPNVVAHYNVNIDAITTALQPDRMVKSPILPFFSVPGENKTIVKVMDAVSKFDLDATDVPALISIVPSVDW